MTEKTTYAPGTFCWPELSTSDQAAAEKFYSALFGWSIKETPMGPDEHYTIFLKDGQDVAAATKLQPEAVKMGAPPHWLSYVATASVDASVEKAKAAGAQLYAGPFDVMELGRMAVLADPTGAVFALWQAKTHPGVALLDAPGSLVWTELVTTDTAKAAAFYTGLFGWKAEVMDMPGMPYTVFKRGTASAGGMMARRPDMGNVPSHWLPYINVTDVDATIAKATALGGKVCAPAMDVPTVGRLAFLADAQGAAFAIINPNPNQA